MEENLACDPHDVATKSFFMGPKAENGAWFSGLATEVLGRWLQWRRDLFPGDGQAISHADRIELEFREQQLKFRGLAMDLATRFEAEIPKFSPRYLGHMFSEISLPALIGHWIATLHNPNNIATESAPVGVQVEREAIEELAGMLGYSKLARGHFTSCGSIANLEAALRARDRAVRQGQKPILLVPENKHYSWLKAAHVLGLRKEDLILMPLDSAGTLDVEALETTLKELSSRGLIPSMVVSVLGSTELGNVDPIDRFSLDLNSDGRRLGRQRGAQRCQEAAVQSLSS